jgi:hypothetical protein
MDAGGSRTTLREVAARLRWATTAYRELCLDRTWANWLNAAPPDGWSFADHTEHVTTANVGIHRMVTTALRPRRRGETMTFEDAAITVQLFDAPGLADAPPRPTGTWIDMGKAILSFERSMGQLMDVVHVDEVELRAGVFEEPTMGVMDGVQWLLCAVAHTESHLVEVRELRDI